MITKQDEQALRAYVKSKPRKVHELRAFLRGRLDRRGFAPHNIDGFPAYALTLQPYEQRRVVDRMIEDAANRAVDSSLRGWKRQGLVDNKVRGTWSWVGK